MSSTSQSKKQSSESISSAPVRQRIVAKARGHFLAHGFRSVTMDDLSVELGMSKKTLYAHFPSKNALLAAVIEDKMGAIAADLDGIAAESTTDFLGALHRLLASLRQHSEELQPPFVRDLGREAPELFALVLTRRRALIQRHFGKLLGEGRKEGLIRRDIGTGLMVEILVGATDALVNPQKLEQLGLSPKTCLSAVVTIFLEGVLTEAGRRKP